MQPTNTKISLLRFLFMLTFSFGIIFNGSLKAQDDPEMKAKELFYAQQYAEALPVFNDLIRLYPDDPELNYYYAASLIETGQYLLEAEKALLASENFEKSQWYLGQYYHANSEWDKARTAYLNFKNSASAKDLKSVPLDEMIDLCNQEQNPFAEAEVETEETSVADTIFNAAIEPDQILATDSLEEEITTELPAVEEGTAPEGGIVSYADSIINFPVNAQITYLKTDQFKTNEAREAFLEARKMENELNSLLKKSNELRAQYDQANDAEKQELANSILTIEQETYRMNRDIAQKDQFANQQEVAWWQNADGATISEFRGLIQHLRDSIEESQKQQTIEMIVEEEAPMIIIEATDSLALDTLQTPIAEPQDEILYKIQIGAYRNTPPDWVQRLFKKLSVLRRIDNYTDEKGVTVYTVGELKTYEDAQQMLKQIKLEGVNNAVIAAYKNNERIPVSEARKISE